MHYKNGREARIGDVVKGKGYNFKHEIIGIMTHITPGSDTCNCTVACVAYSPTYGYQASASVYVSGGKWVKADISPEIKASLEYGQCDAFVALDPNTGEVLPPEIPDVKESEVK